MNKKFFKVSLGIFMFLFISLLGFKFLYGDRKTYFHGAINVPESSTRYLGFEEDDYKYKIKVGIKNNSKYYGIISDIKLKFQLESRNGDSISLGPIFEGYDLKMREYLNNYEDRQEENYSIFFSPSEEKEYIFEVPKGLSFDKEVFDTNIMMINYNIKYLKRKHNNNAVSGEINFKSTTDVINNSIEAFNIE